MDAKPRTYTQYRDAIRTVAALMALPGAPAKHRSNFTTLATDFDANGKTVWMKPTAATAAKPAKTAKAKSKSAGAGSEED